MGREGDSRRGGVGAGEVARRGSAAAEGKWGGPEESPPDGRPEGRPR